MKIKNTLALLSVVFAVNTANSQSGESGNESASLSKEHLNILFEGYLSIYDKVFAKGSTVEDVDSLYSFYTDDFIYNHPKYGGIYSRELLYNNTIGYLKKGGYDNAVKRLTLKTIIGLDAIVVEQRYLDSDETTMTLFKFRNNKIFYIDEYW